MAGLRWWLGGAAALVLAAAACGDEERSSTSRARATPAAALASVPQKVHDAQTGVRVAAQRGIGVVPAAEVAGGVVVNVAGMGFHAEVVRIEAGQTITWTFND